MKDYLDKLRTISEGIESPLIKVLLDSIAAALDTLYNTVLSKLKLTTKLSIGRKLKLNDLYLKLSLMETLKLKLGQYESLINNLSKYRLNAVLLKKQYNSKIKTFFDTKLSNTNNKDYNKYSTIATQFNFDADDLIALDKNRQTYELLLLAGVFGNLKLIAPTISKPIAKPNPSISSRWKK